MARVLIVDDEASMRTCVQRILRGHDVHCASTASQALVLLIAGNRYDLILVDIGLADMTGLDLVESVNRLAPEERSHIVFMTGGDIADALARYPRHVILEKPFDIVTLRALVVEKQAA